jgi:hypothetical protein
MVNSHAAQIDYIETTEFRSICCCCVYAVACRVKSGLTVCERSRVVTNFLTTYHSLHPDRPQGSTRRTLMNLVGRDSKLQSVSHDVFVLILTFLDAKALGRCLQVNASWFRSVDIDAVWKPVAQAILSRRLCLLLEVAATVAGATSISRVCRPALAAAFADATRCTITFDELCRHPFQLRFHRFRNIPDLADMPDEAMPQFWCKFHADGQLRTVDNEAFEVQLDWRFMEAANSFIPATVNGHFMYLPPPTDLPTPTFTCVYCGGRPPLRLWRHPVHWNIVMTNHRVRMATFDMPRMGEDPVMDNDTPYIHPWNFGPESDDEATDFDDSLSGAPTSS